MFLSRKAVADIERDKPCCTCRYDRRTPENAAYCGKYGWCSTYEARKDFCGAFGRGWRAKLPKAYSTEGTYDRIME